MLKPCLQHRKRSAHLSAFQEYCRVCVCIYTYTYINIYLSKNVHLQLQNSDCSLSEISTPAQSLCSLATLFNIAVLAWNLMPLGLKLWMEVPMKIWEGHHIPAGWPCTYPHLNLSSMNAFHWFKGTKEEILAHLTHFDGTVAAHAYMHSSATKALQEGHGQQWRVWHCQSWDAANSTHRVLGAAMDLRKRAQMWPKAGLGDTRSPSS